MTISRRALFGKLDLTLFRAVESATAFAKLRGNPYVELVHWVHQILQLHHVYQTGNHPLVFQIEGALVIAGRALAMQLSVVSQRAALSI